MPLVQVTIDDSTSKTITGYYEFDRSNGGTLVVPSGTSFPGTPSAKELFVKTDTGVLYRRNDGNTDWESISGESVALHREITIDYTDTGSNNLGDAVPSGSIIVVAAVNVTTPFNGTSMSLIAGDSGDTNRLIESGDNDLEAINSYMVYPTYQYGSETQLTVTLAQTGASAGQCTVIVFFEA